MSFKRRANSATSGSRALSTMVIHVPDQIEPRGVISSGMTKTLKFRKMKHTRIHAKGCCTYRKYILTYGS